VSTRLPPNGQAGQGSLTLPRTAIAVIAGVTVFFSLAIFLLGNFMPGAEQRASLLLGFIPARLSGVLSLSPAMPALLTPLSATVVHGNFLHLATNLILLVWCGRAVERIIGPGPTVLLYVLGAFAAAGAQFLVGPNSLAPMIGASGAISALIGAFALTYGRPKPLVKSPVLNRWLNVAWLLAAWIVLQLMMAFMLGQQGMLLATPAHIGGFVAGLALIRPMLLWRYRKA
jgi:membrane associated rhomboid family serine protease